MKEITISNPGHQAPFSSPIMLVLRVWDNRAVYLEYP